MTAPASSPTATTARPSVAKEILIKFVLLTFMSVVLGFTQAWAVNTHTYAPEHVAGFRMGILHGLLMPATMPGLLSGHDLPIYAPSNVGRPYNIGYILGINTCGTLFFGVGLYRPRRR